MRILPDRSWQTDMAITREFLDWSGPALPKAAEWLLHQFRDGDLLSLRNVVLVVPGGRAARRLLEVLVERCEAERVIFEPGKIITPGELPELLYEAKLPFANAVTQEFAWLQALRESPEEDLSQIARRLPSLDDRGGWLALADMIAEIHRELAAEVLDFGHVQQRLEAIGSLREAGRWRILSDIQQRYLRILDGLKLWDKQTARLFAIEHREFVATGPLILIGVADMNAMQRAVLKQVADQVQAWVFASPTQTNDFDEFGCVIPERWQHAKIDGIAGRTTIVNGPSEQAMAVIQTLSEFEDRFRVDDVAVAVPDERIVPYIRQRLKECDLETRLESGSPIRRNPTGRLFRAMASHLERQTFRTFANLVRHPDVERWLRQQGIEGDWLSELDDYYNQRLPQTLGRELLSGSARPRRDGTPPDGLSQAFRSVREWLEPLGDAEKPLHEWADTIYRCVTQVYRSNSFDSESPNDRTILDSIEQLKAALMELARLPELLAPLVTGAEAVRLVQRAFERARLFEESTADSVDLIGWLDVRLDDSPVAILTGMNEGIVPNSRNADMFLPNELRRSLSLEDNDRRYARDAYTLMAILASTPEVRLIAGRRSAENDPLVPSRLLLACPDEELPGRVKQLFDPPRTSLATARIAGSPQAGPRTVFEPPRPVRLPKPIVSMRVTEFADYLKCPYRYYLKQRLSLKTRETTSLEMPPSAFGDLIHDVLEEFGRQKDVRDSSSVETIEDFFNQKLDEMATGTFGTEPLPAVRIQVEQARERLRVFAERQAQWRADGWRVFAAEQKIDSADSFLEVDGEPMYLRGRIDRIDIRETENGLEVAILDYKTGDAGDPPEKKHRKKKEEWVDLQLPLYRQLIRAVDGLPDVDAFQVGYVLLPRELAKTGMHLADWTPDELAEADEVAADVIRNIRRENFWPPREDVQYFREFAAICQDGIYGTTTEDAATMEMLSS
ncbi:PD-(D/E)XK nuclease family protein [Thalassoroseus pseudoceratinae]|uniref:PD-(D/E)XK nuclease family protein n=1 Tax=Thalassoroseus pseudoceratinae TaxID=2713176 RepID=UPI00197FB2FE|nr:PD-(D/E)XK nuclease family protein [Thalassoroseus pseudoceratinae]